MNAGEAEPYEANGTFSPACRRDKRSACAGLTPGISRPVQRRYPALVPPLMRSKSATSDAKDQAFICLCPCRRPALPNPPVQYLTSTWTSMRQGSNHSRSFHVVALPLGYRQNRACASAHRMSPKKRLLISKSGLVRPCMNMHRIHVRVCRRRCIYQRSCQALFHSFVV